MGKSDFKWMIVENIVIYFIIAILFWFTRSGWVFLFLLFVNTFKSKRHRGLINPVNKDIEDVN